MKQPALPIRSNEEIVVAVVIVIADRHSDAVHLDIQARFVRDVAERAVVIVVIKLGRRVLLPVPRPVRSVDQEYIRPPVVIVVDEGHPGAHRLRQKLFAERAVVMNEVDSGFCGDILKCNAGNRALRVRSGKNKE